MWVREWLQKRKETLPNLGFGVIRGSGQLAIYLSEWQTWWMALFMLLCIKRQLWHWLVIFTEVYKKLKFNLEEKEGRDQRRLAIWQSAKTSDGAEGTWARGSLDRLGALDAAVGAGRGGALRWAPPASARTLDLCGFAICIQHVLIILSRWMFGFLLRKDGNGKDTGALGMGSYTYVWRYLDDYFQN